MLIPEQPDTCRTQKPDSDDSDTIIEKWRRGEAFAPHGTIGQSQLSETSAARQASMTLDFPDPGVLPSHLAIDAALCDRLIAQSCEGRDWDAFVTGLYRKATKVTYRWLTEGRIFAEAAKAGRNVAPGDITDWTRDDLRDLAHELVKEAFTLFRRQLLDRKYDASKGASLFTYFMNAVARQFPNVFRRANKARHSWSNRIKLHSDPSEYDQPELEDYHAAHARYANLLFDMINGIKPPQQRQVAWLRFVEGQSNEQIARQLDISSDAARASVNRARTAMKKIYLQQQAEDGGRR